MKIFVAWSGEKSRLVAAALHAWLKDVIQALEPWMSEKDIDKGAQWRSEISGELEDAKFGILCLTSENLSSTWLHFEAGAIAKTVGDTHVCPYLFDLRQADVGDPLAQFQLTNATKDDTLELIKTINRTLPAPNQLSEAALKKAFQRCWPELEEAFVQIRTTPSVAPPKRSAEEILEEILWLVRTLAAAARPKTEEEKERWVAEALHELMPNLPVPFLKRALGEVFQDKVRSMEAALERYVVKAEPTGSEEDEREN
jgi:hypothetical protein